mgnify:CR=1 FL=1
MKLNDEKSWEYFQKETEYLRNIYVDLRKETRSLEVYSLMMVGAIWSWCASNPTSTTVFYLAWLAFIATSLFGMRSLGIYFQMRTIREYLLEIESFYDTENDIGWEQFQNKEPLRVIWPVTSIIFWAILSISTSLFPYLVEVVE